MARLHPPESRECQRCGRRDEWDAEVDNWTIASEEESGNAFCIHEWDINGSHNPIRN
ncbi:HEWD family protein [Halorussus halophilus]|uniref:HEWD family protein n=1 Tax=Halorussus halophilus TaxID=2650975 RepID=UPI001787FC05|nr:HEWD family protein [Halorussus halophilus]